MDLWLAKVQDAQPNATPTRSAAYRNKLCKDGFPVFDVTTTWEAMKCAVEKFPSKEMMAKRPVVDGQAGPYDWMTYSEAMEKMEAAGSALAHCGLKKSHRVGLYGANCPEWMISSYGCVRQGIYSVALYDSLGPDASEFIVNHADVTCVITSAAKLPTLLKTLKNCPEVKVVISMSALSGEDKEKLTALSVTAYGWEEFLEMGRQNSVPADPPAPEDYLTIMYTSGTSGEPKGVLITHRAFLSAAQELKHFSDETKAINADSVFFSFLPLAHIFGRVVEEGLFFMGGSVGYWRGDILLMLDDIAALRPTFFAAVPRVLDRIYSRVKAKVESSGVVGSTVFNMFYQLKLAALKAGFSIEHANPLADAIVFNKVKAQLGGRLALIMSGGAPLSAEVEEFLGIAFCTKTVTGYGLTEMCAGGGVTKPGRREHLGTAGILPRFVETRLESVPELDYNALGTPPRGEICMKGPGLFSGYYKREDLTSEAIDQEGWFHTGDIGEFMENGCLKIIDRKKNIFKLSQGEYVAVEKLETVYDACQAIDQIWLYGNSLESFLIAVVVPNADKLAEWASGAGVQGDYAAQCASEGAAKFILQQIVETGKKAKVNAFEIPKAVHLEPKPFDIDSGLLTPTFKKKRPQLKKHYQAILDGLYEKAKKDEEARKRS